MWHASELAARLSRVGWRRVRRACAALAGALVFGIVLGALAGPTTPSAAPRRVVVLPTSAAVAGDDRAADTAAASDGLAGLQAPPAANASDTTADESDDDETGPDDESASPAGKSKSTSGAKSKSKAAKPTPAAAAKATKAATKRPPVKHVILILLAEKGFTEAFGPHSKAPYLATDLRRQGRLLRNYYATAHGGPAALVGLLSGQASNPVLAAGCPQLTPFTVAGKPAADGQVRGKGCVFPASVPSLPTQLEAKDLPWRAYVEGADLPAGQPVGPCAPPLATATPQQRDPFTSFAAVTGAKDCTSHVTGLAALGADLTATGPTPALSVILPDACHAGREGACPAGEPDGLPRADAWLQEWIPRLLAAPSYGDGKDTMIVVTFDEARATGPQADLSACCGQRRGVNEPAGVDPQAPAEGGGRVGALVLSGRVAPASVSNVAYNHFALLRTIELAFALRPLGLAGAAGLRPFGADVFATGG